MSEQKTIQLHNGLAKEGDRVIGCGDLDPIHATLKTNDNGHLMAFDDDGNEHLIITYDDYFFIDFNPDKALEAVEEELHALYEGFHGTEEIAEAALKTVMDRIEQKRKEP